MDLIYIEKDIVNEIVKGSVNYTEKIERAVIGQVSFSWFNIPVLDKTIFERLNKFTGMCLSMDLTDQLNISPMEGFTKRLRKLIPIPIFHLQIIL